MSSVQAATFSVGKIEGAERDLPPFRLHHVDAAVLQAFQIQVPGILEGHCRDGESMGANPFEEWLPSPEGKFP
ncbi:MAG: hypothetical protein HGA63_10320 [Syntrophobacteraceae bacterium]|nr:hypothetical protein [Syntrophobacteraceae bacterium]